MARAQKLVCYLVPSDDADEVQIEELRELLRSKLPGYMVPSRWVVLDRLPTTLSGKVDRKALMGLDEVYQHGAEYEPPKTDIELQLAALWSELLKVERVGRQGGFLELGGHSLDAVRLVSRIRRHFGVQLDVGSVFRNPTLAGMSAQISRLMSDANTQAIPEISRVAEGSEVLLSAGQERMWFLEQLVPGTSAYLIGVQIHLRGDLDVKALKSSLEHVVHRHEPLHSAIDSTGGRPRLRVASRVEVDLDVEDLAKLDPPDRMEQLAEVASSLIVPFELSRAPLWRARLVRLADRHHVLIWVVHHLVFDAWSTGIMARELGESYAARRQDRSPRLDELPVRYRDYAHWQRVQLAPLLDQQLAYWKERLGEPAAPLELPSPQGRAIGSRQAATVDVELDQELVSELGSLARREGASLHMVLLAALKLLLFRYTGQNDVSIGTPVAGRREQSLEGMIGLFVNTVVVRTQLARRQSFRTLLASVRDGALGAHAHQDVPFERVVEAVAPERDLDQTPLFSVMFVVQNAPEEQLQLPGLEIELRGFGGTDAKFDLAFELAPHPDGGLQGGIAYRGDRVDGHVMARFGQHFAELLRCAVREPDRPIELFGLLTADERQRLAVWNATGAQVPRDRCLHELLADQVERTPDAVAMEFAGEQLSYAELWRRSERVSGALLELGLQPEGRAGLVLERSVEMVVALVGVMRTGAAYVPIDPSYPERRIEQMLRDSGASVVLTQVQHAEKVPASMGAKLVVDATEGQAEGALRTGGLPRTSPDQAMYVLYTSGSTGRPKGVVVPHRGIVNRLMWMQHQYELSAGDVVLQKTPYTFDVSGWELYWPLLVGARLVVLEPERHKDPEHLADTVSRRAVTTMHFVPSMLVPFLQAEGGARCRTLRRVICSGEALAPEHVRQFGRQVGWSELHNLYGPTEAAIDVTYASCDSDAPTVPIGRPVWNTELYVLDREMQPAPLGVAGELFIGGMQVARGYLGRPALTADRFVPDPFGEEPGSRLYRTGDLVKWSDDGQLHFLGRLDHQVKVRGYRIELGEVEALLLEHRAVRQAVVTAREDRAGTKRLVAYVVPGDEAPSTSELRAYLSQSLPEYMVPSALVLIDELPLTSSGKVDRKRLPEPLATRESSSSQYVPPRTPLEHQLAELWAEILEVERPGVHDSFFDLGGHSLLAVVLVTNIESWLGRKPPLSILFEHPTIAKLAAELEREGAPNDKPALLAAGGTQVPMCLVHPVGGEIFCYRPLAKVLGEQRPVYALPYEDHGGEKTVEQMARRYVERLRATGRGGPWIVGGWSFGGLVAYEMACQLVEMGERVEAVVLLDSYLGQQAAESPDEAVLLRAALYDMARQVGIEPETQQRLLEEIPDGTGRQLHERAVELGLPVPASWEQLEPFLAAWRANLHAMGIYRPRPYVGRVLLLQGIDGVDRAEAEAAARDWKAVAGDGLEVSVVEGDHYAMTTAEVGARLRDLLVGQKPPGSASPRAVAMALTPDKSS